MWRSRGLYNKKIELDIVRPYLLDAHFCDVVDIEVGMQSPGEGEGLNTQRERGNIEIHTLFEIFEIINIVY